MPVPFQFTESHAAFIKENRLVMSGIAMAKELGMSKGVIQRYMKLNGLTVPDEIKIKFRSIKRGSTTVVTPEQDEIIKLLYLSVNVNQLAKYLNLGEGVVTRRIRNLGLVIPQEIIEQRKLSARKQKGSVPPNKGKKQAEYMTPEQIARTAATRFKKGQIPANAVGFENGHVSIRTNKQKTPYKYVRIAMGKWVPLHSLEWEKVHGKIPKGHCLWFIDGDSLNADLKNLELITRAENVKRNSGSLNLQDGFVAFTIVGRNNLDLLEIVKQNKPLIELKRQSLILNRTIKSHERKTNSN